MLLVPCPNCGPRNSSDMSYGGEAHTRPDPSSATKAEWRTYLYLRDNPSGWLRENWYCSSGCRRHFQLERHTFTGELRNPPLPGTKTAGKPAANNPATSNPATSNPATSNPATSNEGRSS